MLIEAEAIPYSPAQLRGERLLVLAPHPDDEVIGCGGLIALHRRENRAVRVVIATDGAGAGDAAVREEESRRGLAALGDGIEVEFLRHPDRALGDEAADPIRRELAVFRPDLLLVPSPVEIHPDHAALNRIVVELIQRDETLFADLATTRIAFYEVSQPLRPNAIVDITGVAEAKFAAIAEHASQLASRDYAAYARGLNAYRTMTLPPECRYAEAYWVSDLPSLRTTALSDLRARCGTASIAIEATQTTAPISVVIRTKDRPALLAEAIASVRATGYPCEIVVVNDGGPAIDASLADVVVNHEQSRGRAAAGNAGARAAKNPFLAFLDDDDLFYPEHLRTLANASSSSHAAWYSDAVSAFLRPGESGAYETYSRLRLYAHDFDPELLLLDNYIPLPALLLRRAWFLEAGGFDPAFDLFEDWDLLIRLAARGAFLRIPRVTCEVRHFEGGSSILLAAPAGSDRFRDAKLQVWRKHADRIDHALIAEVLERQKQRLSATYSGLVEAKGESAALQLDVARLEREKQQLIAQNGESTHLINGYALRVRELEGAVVTFESMMAAAQEAHSRAAQLARQLDSLRMQNDTLTRETQGLRLANRETHENLDRYRAEVDRLNALLQMIFRSRTWKLHTLLEKLRGRG
ncbi:MAG TPA: PIG-L family deacetylase [Thermoanaerobaculia bacterium]|nr:PIG-L family deacetylase [Thermoanaerobaculia bacterium]